MQYYAQWSLIFSLHYVFLTRIVIHVSAILMMLIWSKNITKSLIARENIRHFGLSFLADKNRCLWRPGMAIALVFSCQKQLQYWWRNNDIIFCHYIAFYDKHMCYLQSGKRFNFHMCKGTLPAGSSLKYCHTLTQGAPSNRPQHNRLCFSVGMVNQVCLYCNIVLLDYGLVYKCNVYCYSNYSLNVHLPSQYHFSLFW